jgi:SAM-dependent methyltransferase
MDTVKRFSNRAENYALYRPGYPSELVEFLREKARLGAGSRVADVGAGTGKLSASLLKSGWHVYGVEPNGEMLGMLKRLLGCSDSFHPIAGAAEALPLAGKSLDLVVAGQAFHWFDFAGTRAEFRRVLKAGGMAALIWNERQTDTTEFLHEYEAFLNRHCPEYENSRHDHFDLETLKGFFAPDAIGAASFDYRQRFDFDGLRGRLLSCSYAPLDGPGFEPMMRDLRTLFDDHQVDGKVSFLYDTNVFYGPMGERRETPAGGGAPAS